MIVAEHPLAFLAVFSAVLIAVGVVAASGWSPRRVRTRGVTLDFTRKRIG